jgi:hypothetical protein
MDVFEKHHQPKPESKVVTVTPDMAVEILDRNAINRPIRWGRVAQYEQDIKQGRWEMTGEGIKLDADGNLLDGQHRLLACVAAERPFTTFVTVNIAQSAQGYMDSGLARTVGDNLGMAGEKNAVVLAAAGRIGYTVDNGLLFRDRKTWRVSHAGIYDWIEKNPDIRRSVELVSTGRSKRTWLKASVQAYCHFAFARLDVDQADEFISRLGTLNDVSSGSPILTLSDRLNKIHTAGQKVDIPELLSITFRAWNAWREGRTLARIPLATAGTKKLPDLV